MKEKFSDPYVLIALALAFALGFLARGCFIPEPSVRYKTTVTHDSTLIVDSVVLIRPERVRIDTVTNEMPLVQFPQQPNCPCYPDAWPFLLHAEDSTGEYMASGIVTNPLRTFLKFQISHTAIPVHTRNETRERLESFQSRDSIFVKPRILSLAIMGQYDLLRGGVTAGMHGRIRLGIVSVYCQPQISFPFSPSIQAGIYVQLLEAF